MMSYAWSTSSLLVGTAADNRSTGLPVRLASRSNASRNNLTSFAKFSLSSGLPPRRVGYSQSKSKPSKSYFRRKSMTELTKSNRLSVEATIDENAPLPAFQPPTARSVFISLFLFFILLNRSYICGSFHSLVSI